MKRLTLAIPAFSMLPALAQDSTEVDPRVTSFENYNLLLIALVGLVVLIVIYFLWRRRKK